MAERGQITGAVVDGPLALDNAISPEAAAIKKIASPVAGRANFSSFPTSRPATCWPKASRFWRRRMLRESSLARGCQSFSPAARIANQQPGLLRHSRHGRRRPAQDRRRCHSLRDGPHERSDNASRRTWSATMRKTNKNLEPANAAAILQSVTYRPSKDELRGRRCATRRPARHMAAGSHPKTAPVRSSSPGENPTRVEIPELIPIRFGRMSQSPFAFYRGSAAVMAADLASTAMVRTSRAGLRRRAPDEFRRLRHAGAQHFLRHQRFRRDPAGAMGVGRQAAARRASSSPPSISACPTARPRRRRRIRYAPTANA